MTDSMQAGAELRVLVPTEQLCKLLVTNGTRDEVLRMRDTLVGFKRNLDARNVVARMRGPSWVDGWIKRLDRRLSQLGPARPMLPKPAEQDARPKPAPEPNAKPKPAPQPNAKPKPAPQQGAKPEAKRASNGERPMRVAIMQGAGASASRVAEALGEQLAHGFRVHAFQAIDGDLVIVYTDPR